MEKSNQTSKTVHLLYKKLGETPHETILRFKSENPEYKDVSMTYAGRLDPMAEGLLLVLSGDGVMEKEKYLDLPKTYEFEVLWGFETDTVDLLGLQVESGKLKVESRIPEIEKYLKNSISKFEQMYPVYSSRPVGGKSLFQWAREGRISEVQIPKHEVEIFQAGYISRRMISKEELLEDIKHKVGLVNGDFRQQKIIECWAEVLSRTVLDTFIIDKILMKVSSGFYVRQFVSDLAETLGTKTVTFHIKRKKIADFEVEK